MNEPFFDERIEEPSHDWVEGYRAGRDKGCWSHAAPPPLDGLDVAALLQTQIDRESHPGLGVAAPRDRAAAALDVDRLTIAWHRVEGHITPAKLAAEYAALRDEGETT